MKIDSVTDGQEIKLPIFVEFFTFLAVILSL